jgi:uncharacterized protein (TIGR04206 family)
VDVDMDVDVGVAVDVGESTAVVVAVTDHDRHVERARGRATEDGPGDDGDDPAAGSTDATTASVDDPALAGSWAAVGAIAALAALPWSLQTFTRPDSGVTMLFPWGLVNTAPVHVVTLYDYLFRFTVGLPEFILAWPASVLLWGLALASAVTGALVGREDPRVTGALLVLAGIAQVSVATGFSVQPSRSAYPLGTVWLWAVAWWFYWPAVKRGVAVLGG